uniref:DUF7636 domain-containing protein n=1 Tax=Panagrellus redivivus TaxID=6233 RepID=A0A7E4VAV2_PANRE
MQSFEHYINDALMRNLCHLTGCFHIAWRVPDVMTAHNRQHDDYRIRVILWPKGSLNAVQRLRSLLSINAPISRNEKPADLAFLMKHHTTVKMNKLLQARVYV